VVAGDLAATFDGTTCALSGTSDDPGLHQLRYQGPGGTPSSVVLAGVQPPRDWDDLVALLPGFDVETQPPAWVLMGPAAADELGSGMPVTATGDLEDATYGPVCMVGTWPDVTFTLGAPFQTGSGRIGP
jgi:hypothetical protein